MGPSTYHGTKYKKWKPPEFFIPKLSQMKFSPDGEKLVNQGFLRKGFHHTDLTVLTLAKQLILLLNTK